MHPFAKRFHEIMTDGDLSAVDKMVVAVLWFHCGNNSHCWPSIPTLAKEVGADRKTIVKSLKNLLSKNRVEIIKSKGKSNRYCLVTSATSGTTTSPKCGSTSSPKSGTTTHTTSGTTLPQNQSQKRDYYPISTSPKNGTRKELRTKNKKIQNPPYPPEGDGVKKAKAFPILKTAEEVCRALETVDLTKAKATWEPHGVDVQDVWLTFQETCLSGTATKPVLNPYNYRDMNRAFNDWCRRRKEQGPRGSPLPPKNKPSPRDVVAQVLKERKENGNR